ncbi:hypothetical protein [Achromobacter sp. AGC25]
MNSFRQIQAGRAMLAAEVMGRGDPVIFLHPAICDRRMWRAQMEVTGTAHLLTLDQPDAVSRLLTGFI